MLIFGCLLAFAAAFAPRVVLLLAWIFNGEDRWNRVWGGNWFWPLLGIIFLPYTTIMYMLVWQPTGIQGWAWMWIGLGLFMDIMKWGQIANNRRGVPGYPKGQAPAAAVATGTSAAPVAAAVVATDSSAAPVAAAPAPTDTPPSATA